MRNIARFVVDTHSHISTLYQPKGAFSENIRKEGKWNGMIGEVAAYDNSALALYDMDRFGVDMAVLLPSMCGTYNEKQVEIMKKHPDRFRACCSDQLTMTKAMKGEIQGWNLQMSLDEIEAALKTENYVGIGEFVPGLNLYRYGYYPAPEFEKRVEEWDAFCELAIKYDVPVHFHEYIMFYRLPKTLWNHIKLLETVAGRHPKAKIVFNHGYKDPDLDVPDLIESMRDVYAMVSSYPNIYMETGGWCEKNFEVAFDSGVSARNLMWGHDYGNVPQYMFRKNILDRRIDGKIGLMTDPRVWEYRKVDAQFGSQYKGVPTIPTYQPNFYAWGMRTVDRVGDWLTQDEIDLIMGGTAARLYKLPVPFPRMFAEGRPDIFGENWQHDWYPFIPDEQITNPEGFRIPIERKYFDDSFSEG
ncbi:MAG: amidohydrolase [Clostridiales Family XIII bacterium]|jgi:predicted TIM-barrel fold metal-dependent hydrolase|nr:amidohydrolase [Clostridiales Family XIII bacterium]